MNNQEQLFIMAITNVLVDDKMAQRLKNLIANAKEKNIEMEQETETNQDKTKSKSSEPAEKTDIDFGTDDQTVKKGLEQSISTAKDSQHKQLDQNKTVPQNRKGSDKTTEGDGITIEVQLTYDMRWKHLVKKVVINIVFP